MRPISLKKYTLRYFSIIIPVVIALWAGSFYWLIIDEVYDNIDDGLKDTELRIKRALDENPDLLNTEEFGLANFKFTALPAGEYDYGSHIYNSSMYMEYDGDDEPVRILQSLFEINGEDYLLEIYASTIEEDEFAVNLFLSLIGLYILLVAALVLINHFVLRKVWKPFYSLMDQTEQYQLGEKTKIDTSPNRITEFVELEERINEMIIRSEKTYAEQKQFIENAAHELQTPIAIMGNKLEMMFAEDSTDENRAAKISELLSDLRRMKQLNKSLLLLSKIENTQFNGSSLQDFNAVTKEILEDTEALYAAKNLKIDLSEKGDFKVESNAQLTKVLLSNLIRNAFIHTPAEGFINIEIDSDSWSIKNSGDTPLEDPKIFERFYHTSAVNISSGLGLAIVKSIIDNTPGLHLSYHFEEGHLFLLSKTSAF